MKKIITLLFPTLLSLVPILASAHDIEVKNAEGQTIYYNYAANGNDELSVTYRGTEYYAYDDEYTENVIIPSEVTYNNKTLKVTSIGYAAFYNCSKVTSITIPNSVTRIIQSAFNGCSNLTSITIPSGLTRLGDYAFRYCSSLTSITIPNGVTSIGKSVFEGCSGLNSITIRSNVTSIGENAFQNCSGLTSITIPSNVTSIGENAFQNCSSLTSITIPSNVTSIGKNAFFGCSKLTKVTLNSNSIVSKTNYETNLSHIFSTSVKEIIMGSSVRRIGDYAFLGFSRITSVTIPYGVTSIGNSAFSSCSGLISITIPNNVISIGSRAFSSCSSLTSITIPNKVKSIGSNAFYGCTGELTINCKIPSSSSNYDGVFYGSNFSSIKISEGVDSIGNYAFYNCSNLSSVEISNSVISIGSNAFYGCTGITSLTIPNSVTSIGNSAFYNCSGLTSVTIGNSVTSIGNSAFSGCSGLTSVTIPNSVTSIGNSAFSGCTGLESIYIPKGTCSQYKYLGGSSKVCMYEMDGDQVWSEVHFGVPTSFTTYYDYDGDGVMEYLSREIKRVDGKYNEKIGLFDRSGNLKHCMFEFESSSSYSHELPNVTPINGEGTLLSYSYYDRGGIYDINGYENNEKYSLLVDIDNDGRKDLVDYVSFTGKPFNIYYQQPDGTFKATEQVVSLDAEAIAKEASKKGAGGVVSFAVGMMIGGSSSNPERLTSLDMNDDGIQDMMGVDKGGVLYSYADNKFFANSKKGVLYPCDLNGDSELDYICYDGNAILLMTRSTNNTYDEKALFNNKNVKQIIYKDFDHDGDIDILAYINDASYETSTSGTTYFVFFRNDGDLSFKRRERNFALNLGLLDVKDVDADGLYEMMVTDYTNKVKKLLRISEDLTVAESDFDFSDEYEYGGAIAVGDFDNDGRIDYRYSFGSNSVKYGIFSQDAINKTPEKMDAPKAVLKAENGRLLITWKQGKDAETSPCDLTYELRIGTQPASGDVLFGTSLADGSRRTLEGGNMGLQLKTLFNANSLKPGKYYISVQAVDAGGRGGAWSDDFVYEHQLAVPVIVSNYTNQMTAADTLCLNVKTPINGAEYKWTVSEGRQIENDGNNAKYVFEHDGKHTVNLAMIYDGKTLNAEPLMLKVEPAKYGSSSRTLGYVDINQDGYPEYFGYANDGEGNIEKVLLSYVTDIPSGTGDFLDYNLDGYPDFVISNRVYVNMGEQDNDFDFFTETFKAYKDNTTYTGFPLGGYAFDANNDGYMDKYDPSNSYYNNGSYTYWISYSKILTENFGAWDHNQLMYDVNRDGVMDWVVYGKKKDSSERNFYVMYKDQTADMNYTEPQLLFKPNESMSDWMVEDVNNDGYVDLIGVSSGKLIIIKGSETKPCTETVTCELPVPINSIRTSGTYDFNNDGYLDIVYYDEKYKKYLVEFGADFKTDIIEMTSDYYSHGKFMVQKNGGYPDGYLSNIKNLPPSAPATVAAKQTKDGMLITWSDAQDDHTPAMQMRYNISVKRKGKKGDNSFVISPMNGLKDKATICGTVIYKKSTQMLVPASVLTAGDTYEIQVQALDLWNQHSPMTKAIEFTMNNNVYIDVAEKVAVGKETEVRLMGAQSDTYSLAAGTDATIVSNNGNGEFTVRWSSEGVKELVLTAGTKTIKSTVTVVKPVDLTFSVLEQVFANSPLTITVNDEMAAEPKDVGMRVVGNSKIKVEYLAGSKTATVTFPSTGTYELEAYSTDDIRGNSYKQTVNVTASMPKPAIEQVGVDAGTGYYAINWNAGTLPSGISKAVISKESTTTGVFSAIDTVDVKEGQFIDKSSNPVVQTSRYTIQLIADNGQISESSLPHKPLHVMLMKATSGYNLIWNYYEGISVQGYDILRGTSPDNMKPIAQVAGSINNYTDITAPSGTNYYAVTIQNGTSQSVRSASRGITDISGETISSNVISTESAIEGVTAENIEIITLDNDKTLNDEHKDLQLYTLILPTYSTVSTVMWEITEGNSLASIDNKGILHGKGGEGNVTVQARTIDGSDLSAEITVPVSIQKIVLRGDANGDGEIGMPDVMFIVNYILGTPDASFNAEAADANLDGEVGMPDVMYIVNYILNGKFPEE